MKFLNIRRVGILVFGLFLALTLTLIAAAPGLASSADDSPKYELEIIATGDGSKEEKVSTLNKRVGDTITLDARWVGGVYPPNSLYEWRCWIGDKEYTDIVEFQDSSGANTMKKVTATVLRATEPVTITVTAYSSLTGNETASTEFTLKTAEPVWTVTNTPAGSTLLVGDEKTLTVNKLTNVPATGVTYQWDITDGDKSVKLSAGDTDWTSGNPVTANSVKVTGKTGGTATITVSAVWEHKNCPNNSGTSTSTSEYHVLATYTLNLTVTPPALTVKDSTGTIEGLSLKIGGASTLTAEATGVRTSLTGITYEWSVKTGKDYITLSGSGGTAAEKVSGDSATVAGQASGTAVITIIANWEGAKIAEKDLTVNVSKPTLTVKENGETVGNPSLQIGDTADLTVELTGIDNISDQVSFDWEPADSTIVTITKGDKGKTATVTGKAAGSVTVTVTAKLDGKQIGEEAKFTLTVVRPELKLIDEEEQVVPSLELKIDEEATLTAQFIPGTAPVDGPVNSGGKEIEPTYTWEWVTKDGKPFDGAALDKNTGSTVTVTALQSGEAKLKVTATWADSGATATCELTVTVAGPTLKITDKNGKEVTSLPLEIDEWAELTAVLEDGPTSDVTYTWSWSEADGSGEEAQADEDPGTDEEPEEPNKDPILLEPTSGPTTKVTAKNATGKEVTVTVTASWGSAETSNAGLKKATCTVTVLAPVEEITLEDLDLVLGGTATLEPTFRPAYAINKGVIWDSDNKRVATVDQNGKVTAVGLGTAKITATSIENPEVVGTCTVTVTAPGVGGLIFTTSGPIVWANSDPVTWELSVGLLPAGAELGGGWIRWTMVPKSGSDASGLSVTGVEGTLRAQVKSLSPGEYTVTATYMVGTVEGPSESIDVTVSGIVLSRSEVRRLLVGQTTTLAVDKVYGFAGDSVSTTDVDWSSSDPSTVSVMYGELTGWKLGKNIIITATKNGYSAQCVVDVTEDEDVIAGPYSATTGKPLVFLIRNKDGSVDRSCVYYRLNEISIKKTQVEDVNGNLTGGSPLDYITNLSVPTSQGNLYYNYDSEANTGDGIGITDRFAEKASGSIRGLDRLYFVPKQGFKGIAEITFTGWAVDGTSFTGIIKVDVAGSDKTISYRTKSGTPVYFLADDFDAFCRSRNGRGMNYVTFKLPQASQGALYYNYVAGDGIRVSASTRFSQTGRYTVGDVCFVPNAAAASEVRITFQGMDTAGVEFDGEVVINIEAAGVDSSGSYFSSERGGPVKLQGSLLNTICQEMTHDTLKFVIFKLPALTQGTLYYNYRGPGDFESRVNATTRYFFSGPPAINDITFVPAPGATGQIPISYTGYSTAGTTYEGTLYINLDEVDYTTIYYFVTKNSSVSFSQVDFNNAGLNQTGLGVNYVTFELSTVELGSLYYGNTRITSSTTRYYVSPTSSQNALSRVSFRAGGEVGPPVTITYKAYRNTSSQPVFTGSVVIQVGTLTPADTDVSCKNSARVWMSGSALSRTCGTAMTGSLSYIEITSLPAPEEGHLYLNYYGFGTGTAVNPGDRFYCTGSPNINQLCFVPRAGFTGEAEITYIGYSGDSLEQVSGRVMVNVTSNTTSSFNDMDGYAWAIDSVEYLKQTGTVEGTGDGGYNPTGVMSKGDFVLMLVRAYGLSASGNASFNDVPADKYYADAIRVAAVLGIVQGYNGYFNPTSPLSRQDAMVMIFNIMKFSGKKLTNGLTADFSVFHDESGIAPYAREAMGSLIQMGIVKGDGSGHLVPNRQLNRAEAAVLMHTIMTL